MSDISAGNSLSVPQLYSYSIVPFMFAQPLTVNIFPFGFNFTFIQRVSVFFTKTRYINSLLLLSSGSAHCVCVFRWA